MATTGEIPSMVPRTAVDVEMRPPIFKYFKVPMKATNRTRCFSSSSAAAIWAPVAPGVAHAHRLPHQESFADGDVQGIHQVKPLAALCHIFSDLRRLERAGQA